MSKAVEVIESEAKALEAELERRHEALDALAGTNHRMVQGTTPKRSKRKSPTPNTVIDAAIVKYLEGREKPAKAKYISSAMARQIGVGHKTVYRSLNRLTQKGILVETTGGKHHKRWTVNHPATETATPVETVKTPFYTSLGM